MALKELNKNIQITVFLVLAICSVYQVIMKVIQRVTSLAPVDSVCNLRNLFCTTGSGNRRVKCPRHYSRMCDNFELDTEHTLWQDLLVGRWYCTTISWCYYFLDLINIWHSSVETQGYSLLCEILHWCPFIDGLEFHMVMNVTSWWVIFCTLFFGGSELSVKRRSRSSARRRCLRQWHYNTGFFGLGSYLAYITWARAVVEYALFRMTHSEKKYRNENTRNPPASRGGTMWRFFPNTISHKWRKDCC